MLQFISVQRSLWFLPQEEPSGSADTHLPPHYIRSILSVTTTSSKVPESDEIQTPEQSRAAQRHLQQKILRLVEQIRVEETERDQNLSEYLQMANNVEKRQAFRIKQTFEHRNQKSAAAIAQLQHRLEHYHHKVMELKELELKLRANPEQESKGRSPRLSNVTRESSLSMIQSMQSVAPRKPATWPRNGRVSSSEPVEDTMSLRPPDFAMGTLKTTVPAADSRDMAGTSPDEAASSRVELIAEHLNPNTYTSILQQLADLKEEQVNLEASFEKLRENYQHENKFLMNSIQEEKHKYRDLEAQVNDLMDIQQTELMNIKQDLSSMEEKLVYQSYDRARDLWEVIESFQTRIGKLELQQQAAQLEVLENPSTRAFFAKFMSLVLASITVILVFVSAMTSITIPLVKTRLRTLTTIFLLLLGTSYWWHQALFTDIVTFLDVR
uniref:Transmembrane and coiled-coil domain family 3 n=1 Tax=Latimeria chalumnae TaxID=7897 RepID=H3APY7_LATCH